MTTNHTDTNTNTNDDMLVTPCITAGLTPPRDFLVADYNDVQRERYNQPLWARVVPAVEHLTEDPAVSRYGVHITHQAAYRAQMRALLGLDQPPSSSTAA